MPRIFAHIPAYRDRECQWTIRDMFAKARYPERVFAGICWQTVPEVDADCFTIAMDSAQVRAVHFHIDDARGLGWARQQAQSLWQGEEYSLQIDSHMRFIPDWDAVMLDMLAACDSPDPVLTVYPPAYIPPDRLIEREQVVVQTVKRFLPSGLLDFSGEPIPRHIAADRPFPTASCAGGFIFGSSRMLQDVPPDPDLFFNGEEPNLAVRLWTSGFDLFSPHRTVIYHYYTRNEGARPWNDSAHWNDRHKRTLQRMHALCVPQACTAEDVAALGRYGLGQRRSLAAYEAFSGVNFAGGTIADYARVYPFVRQPTSQLPASPDEALQPAPEARLFLLQEEGVLFQEDRGELYHLNTAATFAWCAREEGYDWPRIAGLQAASRGVSREVAMRDLCAVTDHWRGQGLLRRPEEQSQPVPGMRRAGPCLDPAYHDFRSHDCALLGQSMRVRYGDAELESLIHPVIAHLAAKSDQAPAHIFSIVRILGYVYLFCDETLLHHGDNPAALAPPLKFHMTEKAVRHCDPILQLHAGAVEIDGWLALIPGQTGDGKTTLTSRLVAAGGRYFSDEVVLIERGTVRVRPVPMSFCVKASAVPLLQRYFPALPALPEYHRDDGFKVRYLPPPRSSLPPRDHAAVPRVVVFRRYRQGAKLELRKLTSGEGFGRVMANCVAIPRPLSLTDASSLVALAQGLEFYELSGSDLEEQAEAVAALCRARR